MIGAACRAAAPQGEAVRVEAIHSNGSISVHLRSSPLKSLVVDKRDRAAQLLRMLAAVGCEPAPSPSPPSGAGEVCTLGARGSPEPPEGKHLLQVCAVYTRGALACAPGLAAGFLGALTFERDAAAPISSAAGSARVLRGVSDAESALGPVAAWRSDISTLTRAMLSSRLAPGRRNRSDFDRFVTGSPRMRCMLEVLLADAIGPGWASFCHRAAREPKPGPGAGASGLGAAARPRTRCVLEIQPVDWATPSAVALLRARVPAAGPAEPIPASGPHPQDEATRSSKQPEPAVPAAGSWLATVNIAVTFLDPAAPAAVPAAPHAADALLSVPISLPGAAPASAAAADRAPPMCICAGPRFRALQPGPQKAAAGDPDAGTPDRALSAPQPLPWRAVAGLGEGLLLPALCASLALSRLVAAVDTPVLRSRLDAALGMGRRASASRLVAGDAASPPSVVLPSLPPAELLQADPSAPLVIPERSPSDSGSAGSTCRASLRALLAVVPPALPAKGLRVATLDGWSKRWARLTLRQRAAAVVVADAACVDTWQGALGQRPAQAAHAWAQSMLKSSRAEEAAAAPKPADAPFAQQVSDAVTLLLGSSTGEAGSDRAPKSLMGSVAMGGVSESAGTERLDGAAAAAAADRGQCGSAEWWREALGPAACIVCVEPMRALPAAEAPAATG